MKFSIALGALIVIITFHLCLSVDMNREYTDSGNSDSQESVASDPDIDSESAESNDEEISRGNEIANTNDSEEREDTHLVVKRATKGYMETDKPRNVRVKRRKITNIKRIKKQIKKFKGKKNKLNSKLSINKKRNRKKLHRNKKSKKLIKTGALVKKNKTVASNKDKKWSNLRVKKNSKRINKPTETIVKKVITLVDPETNSGTQINRVLKNSDDKIKKSTKSLIKKEKNKNKKLKKTLRKKKNKKERKTNKKYKKDFRKLKQNLHSLKKYMKQNKKEDKVQKNISKEINQKEDKELLANMNLLNEELTKKNIKTSDDKDTNKLTNWLTENTIPKNYQENSQNGPYMVSDNISGGKKTKKVKAPRKPWLYFDINEKENSHNTQSGVNGNETSHNMGVNVNVNGENDINRHWDIQPEDVEATNLDTSREQEYKNYPENSVVSKFQKILRPKVDFTIDIKGENKNPIRLIGHDVKMTHAMKKNGQTGEQQELVIDAEINENEPAINKVVTRIKRQVPSSVYSDGSQLGMYYYQLLLIICTLTVFY